MEKFFMTKKNYQGLPSGLLVKKVDDESERYYIMATQSEKTKEHLIKLIKEFSKDQSFGFGDEGISTYSINSNYLSELNHNEYLGRIRTDEDGVQYMIDKVTVNLQVKFVFREVTLGNSSNKGWESEATLEQDKDHNNPNSHFFYGTDIDIATVVKKYDNDTNIIDMKESSEILAIVSELSIIGSDKKVTSETFSKISESLKLKTITIEKKFIKIF